MLDKNSVPKNWTDFWMENGRKNGFQEKSLDENFGQTFWNSGHKDFGRKIKSGFNSFLKCFLDGRK